MKALGPGRKRIITPEWAQALYDLIEERGRSYQAELSRVTGCSESMINRMKNGHVKSSKWVEPISQVTGIPLPPYDIDPRSSEILDIYDELPEAFREALLRTARSFLGSPNPENDESE